MPDEAVQSQHPAFDRYPLARPFADLIVGETEEDVEEMARVIDARLRASTAPAAPPAPAARKDQPERDGRSLRPAARSGTPTPFAEFLRRKREEAQ